MSTTQSLREYFQGEYGDKAKDLSDDESLLERGLLDSMAIVKLIAHLEDNYGVVLSDEEFDPDNFETLNAIQKLIDEKKS